MRYHLHLRWVLKLNRIDHMTYMFCITFEFRRSELLRSWEAMNHDQSYLIKQVEREFRSLKAITHISNLEFGVVDLYRTKCFNILLQMHELKRVAFEHYTLRIHLLLEHIHPIRNHVLTLVWSNDEYFLVWINYLISRSRLFEILHCRYVFKLALTHTLVTILRSCRFIFVTDTLLM